MNHDLQSATLWIGGFGAVVAGSMLLFREARVRWADRLGFASTHEKVAPVIGSSGDAPLIPSGLSEIPVYLAPELIDRLGLRSVVQSIESRTGLTKANFAKDCLPVIHAVVELVQLFPASESHHHASPGGLAVHALECANHALAMRQGMIMPRGAAPEDISMHQHRWTFAVLLGAMLHDIGKPMADLRVIGFKGSKPLEWSPLMGSLVQCQMSGYRVSFREERVSGAHERLAVTLMQTLVPQPVMQWLGEDSKCIETLVQYLSGEAKKEVSGAGHDNQIASLVIRADQESVRHNLAHGSRSRFASARAQPLIERTMQALRELMQAQLALPLNRKGAAGWVFQGDVWFVSKRLVDEIRNHLQLQKKDQGFPGPDRNDRVFDTLQEYRALVQNPMTHGAIWSVRIEQVDGWSGQFTVVRIPLEKLFANESEFPAAMTGIIKILARETIVSETVVSAPTVANVESTGAALPFTPVADKRGTPESPFAPPPPSPTDVRVAGALSLTPEHLAQYSGATVPINTRPSSIEAMVERAPTDSVHELPGAVLADGSVSANEAASQADEDVANKIQDLAEVKVDDPLWDKVPAEYLAVEDSAPAPKSRSSSPVGGLRLRISPRTELPPAEILSAVVPATPKDASLAMRKRGKEASDGAKRFMRWLQEGIASGESPINQSRAHVHFGIVEHPSLANEGQNEVFMLLVSPVIFRAFAEATVTASDASDREAIAIAGSNVQRDFLKAGWHLAVNPGNINILRFMTKQRPGAERNMLSCIAVRYPERFVNPVPPINAVLQYSHETSIRIKQS